MADTDSLSQISDKIADVPDAQAEAELDVFRERAKLTVMEWQQDLEARKKYAKDVFKLVVSWLLAVLVVVLLDGFALEYAAFPLGFDLSDKVMMTLLGGTTVNVLGILAIVVRYLFPTRVVRRS